MGNFKRILVRVFSQFLIFGNMSSEREFSKTLGVVTRALVYEHDYFSFSIFFAKIIFTACTCLLTYLAHVLLNSCISVRFKIKILKQLFLRPFVFLDYATQDFAEATFHKSSAE